MKIEEGMYVRTKHYGIFKILNIEKQNKTIFLKKARGLDCVVADKYNPIEEEVLKANHNIIDLIEIGDYVNGYRIVKIFVNKYNGKKLLIALCREEDYEYSDKLEDYMCDDSIHIYEENIKTILTKEQFENKCYKVIEK